MRELNHFEKANLQIILKAVEDAFMNYDLPLMIITGNAETQQIGSIRVGDVSEQAVDAAMNAFVDAYGE